MIDSPFMWIVDALAMMWYTKWLIRRKYIKIRKILIKALIEEEIHGRLEHNKQ
jgi:hypothetical protein